MLDKTRSVYSKFPGKSWKTFSEGSGVITTQTQEVSSPHLLANQKLSLLPGTEQTEQTH